MINTIKDHINSRIKALDDKEIEAIGKMDFMLMGEVRAKREEALDFKDFLTNLEWEEMEEKLNQIK